MAEVTTPSSDPLRIPDGVRESRNRMLTAVFPAVALLLGLCQAWAGRHLMNPDGVSYIDMADAYLRGDWHSALNPYWSPFYPWILSAGLRVFHPSAYWEFPVVHLVNFGIYGFTVCCFHFFLLKLIQYDRAQRQERQLAAIPKAIWVSVGYTVFIVFSLEWIGLEVVAPDMCVAGVIFLASGLVLRMCAGRTSWTLPFLLGICLGAAYLIKVATALPVILCFVLAGMAPGRPRAWLRLAILCAGMLLVAGPYIRVLSQRQGRLTFSEAGKLNYAWYVNAVPNHWLGELPGSGKPLHPHTKLLNYPAAFAYDRSAPGTYPGWFDPAYWYDGVTPHLDVRRQLYVIKTNAQLLFDLIFDRFQVGLIAGMLALYLFCGGWRLTLRALGSRWFLLAPASLAVGMYCLIWIESRFFGAVLTVFWMGVLSALPLPDRPEARRVLSCIAAAAVLVTLAPVVETTLLGAYRSAPPTQWQVADFLQRTGIEPGDPVAVIGHVNRCGWARLARVQIIAEIPHESEADFDAANDEVKSKALGALFSTGVRAVVADHRVESGCRSGWRAAGQTGFYVCTAE